MTGAPAVSYPVSRSRVLGFFVILLWLTGAALAVFWSFSLSPREEYAGLATIFIVSALSGFALLAFWRGLPTGLIQWDGSFWHLQSRPAAADTAAVELRIGLDGQRWLLLRCQHPSRRRSLWLWAQASFDPPRWHLLRCALYSRADDACRA